MLPAARTFCPAAGFLCFNRGDDFFRKNGAPERPQALRCSETKWDFKDAQSERGVHSESPCYKKGSCAEIHAAAFCLCKGCTLLNAGNRIILCFHGLLQHLIVYFGVQGNDSSTGFVADNSLVHLRQSL